MKTSRITVAAAFAAFSLLGSIAIGVAASGDVVDDSMLHSFQHGQSKNLRGLQGKSNRNDSGNGNGNDNRKVIFKRKDVDIDLDLDLEPEQEYEGTLLVADVQFEDAKDGNIEASANIFALEMDNGIIMDLEDMSPEWKKKNHHKALTGRERMKIIGNLRRNKDVGNAYGSLKVKKGANMTTFVESKRQKSRANDRRLATGEKSVAIVRVIASDSVTSDSKQVLSDSILGTNGDSVTLSSQYAACSYDQLTFVASTNSELSTENGAAGTIDITIPQSVSGVDNNSVRNAVTSVIESRTGRSPSNLADYVIYCLPPGTAGGWIAYAFINSWLSVYNDEWCKSLSGLLHEVGHNLGLGHSNENGAYQDQSGMMGFSYFEFDTPRMCFNACKNFQFGWYGQETFDPLTGPNVWNKEMVGVADYGKITSSQSVVIRIETGTPKDFFVGFNRKIGINEGTLEAGDLVTITQSDQADGEGYNESEQKAKLGAGDAYTVAQNFRNTGKNLQVTVKSIRTNQDPAVADVEIRLGENSCESNENCDDGNTCNGLEQCDENGECQSGTPVGGERTLAVTITTDQYPQETSWSVTNPTGATVLSESAGAYTTIDTFTKTAQVCPLDGQWSFIIDDSFGDGICCQYGNGQYEVSLDGAIIAAGGSFGSSETKAFAVSPVGPPPPPPPPLTESPTKVPSLSPTRSQSMAPSKAPTKTPTRFPSSTPSLVLSGPPSSIPSSAPSSQSSTVPSALPSLAPSGKPTINPSNAPSVVGSSSPSVLSSSSPSVLSSSSPSVLSSSSPSVLSSSSPSVLSSSSPSVLSSSSPSVLSSSSPSVLSSSIPSAFTSSIPSVLSSSSPSVLSSSSPSVLSSSSPSVLSSSSPSALTSSSPSILGSPSPSALTSPRPSVLGSPSPSMLSSSSPSENKSSAPSRSGSLSPSASSTNRPSSAPTPPIGECTTLTVELLTDNYPSETTWTVSIDSTGETIGSGSSYSSAATTFTLSVPSSGCLEAGSYTFTISDSYGDGICCAYGLGSYKLTLSSGEVIKTGGEFAFFESESFTIEGNGPNPPSAPSVSPTKVVSPAPSVVSSSKPSITSSIRPSGAPTSMPSAGPTKSSTNSPSLSPTTSPSGAPTAAPVLSPSASPPPPPPPPPPVESGPFDLTTPYCNADSGGCYVLDGIMYDVRASTTKIIVDTLSIYTYAPTGTFDVYTRSGTHVGNTNSLDGWTQVAEYSYSASNFATVEIPSSQFVSQEIEPSINGGIRAFYVTLRDRSSVGAEDRALFTLGNTIGSLIQEDSNGVQIFEGTGKTNNLFTYNPSAWKFNGVVKYTIPTGQQCSTASAQIITDQYPGETTWQIVDDAGSTVASGGPYSSSFATFTSSRIPASGCLEAGSYTFTINDSFGDGICCQYGLGSYTVSVDGAEVLSGGEFGSTESQSFSIGATGAGAAATTGDNIFE